jgi:hypothetical protein
MFGRDLRHQITHPSAVSSSQPPSGGLGTEPDPFIAEQTAEAQSIDHARVPPSQHAPTRSRLPAQTDQLSNEPADEKEEQRITLVQPPTLPAVAERSNFAALPLLKRD